MRSPTYLCSPRRLDDAIAMARDEEGFMQRWRDDRGHIKGMAHRAPDEWVISSELNINHKKVS